MSMVSISSANGLLAPNIGKHSMSLSSSPYSLFSLMMFQYLPYLSHFLDIFYLLLWKSNIHLFLDILDIFLDIISVQFSPFLILSTFYQYLPKFTNIYQHSPIFTNIQQYLPTLTDIYQHSTIFTNIHRYLPIFIIQSFPIFTISNFQYPSLFTVDGEWVSITQTIKVRVFWENDIDINNNHPEYHGEIFWKY